MEKFSFAFKDSILIIWMEIFFTNKNIFKDESDSVCVGAHNLTIFCRFYLQCFKINYNLSTQLTKIFNEHLFSSYGGCDVE